MVAINPKHEARRFGLTYVTGEERGFTRVRWGRGFRYRTPSGGWLRSRAHLSRIEALVIPPAWKDVWICRDPRGHLQATGFDQRGRKQYRYHDKWLQQRNKSKFCEMRAFAEALPAIRRRVQRDLRRRGMPREKVVACIVHLPTARSFVSETMNTRATTTPSG